MRLRNEDDPHLGHHDGYDERQLLAALSQKFGQDETLQTIFGLEELDDNL